MLVASSPLGLTGTYYVHTDPERETITLTVSHPHTSVYVILSRDEAMWIASALGDAAAHLPVPPPTV